MAALRAPVPQPTSSHRRCAGIASQSRNSATIKRLHRPLGLVRVPACPRLAHVSADSDSHEPFCQKSALRAPWVELGQNGAACAVLSAIQSVSTINKAWGRSSVGRAPALQADKTKRCAFVCFRRWRMSAEARIIRPSAVSQNRSRGPIGWCRSINTSRSAPRASEGLVIDSGPSEAAPRGMRGPGCAQNHPPVQGHPGNPGEPRMGDTQSP